jgi:hypothetical protein
MGYRLWFALHNDVEVAPLGLSAASQLRHALTSFGLSPATREHHENKKIGV